MAEFWGGLIVAIVLLFFLRPVLQIADAANDIANYLCDVDYDDDDDPDKEPVLGEDSVNAESDIHLEGLKPLGKVLPFKKTG